jgi:rhodanese-related sulfurtransferase
MSNSPVPSGRPTTDDRGLPLGAVIRPEYELTPRQVGEQLQSSNPEVPLIVDVRTAAEFQVGHIAGALHIPLHEIEKRYDEIVDAAAGRTVVTICHHGVRSLKASLFLRQVGVAGAMSMAGGMDAWSLAIDAAIPRYERSGDTCRVIG